MARSFRASCLCLLRLLWLQLIGLLVLSMRIGAQMADMEDTGIYLGDRIIDAINCGGPAHTDVYGIRYRSDPLEGKSGIASDFGRRYLIGRAPPSDQVLYQTERYSTEKLTYEIKIPEDGDYVLVLKFSEVYFDAPGQKVFDVQINNEHMVVTDLDIFSKVGRGVAHEEQIPFTVKSGKLRVFDEASDWKGKLIINFIKGERDNPKVNAMYVFRGKSVDIPTLPALHVPEALEEIEEPEEPETADRAVKHASGPKIPDPYAAQDQSQMFLPILIALACFFPVLFCLCKL